MSDFRAELYRHYVSAFKTEQLALPERKISAYCEAVVNTGDTSATIQIA